MVTAAALAGFSLLLVAAFGIRSVLHWRQTGATGWVTPPTRAAWIGDGLFTLGLVGSLAAGSLDMVGVIDPIEVIDAPATSIAGAVLVGGGMLVALTAQAQMGAAWRAGIEVSGRDALVRRGLFARVRNPFYLGMALASGGVALMVPNVAALVAWGALVAGCEIDVRLVEEPHLSATHGEAYRDYAAATGRFVPLVGRLRNP